MSFLPQKWPKRFAYTQLTYLVSYLDGNVKQKQTQNTTNHSDSTMDKKHQTKDQANRLGNIHN